MPCALERVLADVEHVAAVGHRQRAARVLLDHHDRDAGAVDRPRSSRRSPRRTRARGRPTARRAAAPAGRASARAPSRPSGARRRSSCRPPGGGARRAGGTARTWSRSARGAGACPASRPRGSPRRSGSGRRCRAAARSSCRAAVIVWGLAPVMSSPRAGSIPARLQQPEDRLDQCRLAGAVGADDGDDLALADRRS